MSVIFQLFRAADLKDLTLEQLEVLKMTIRDALKIPANIPDQVKDRAHDVFRQLKGRDPAPVQPVPSLPILSQLFSEADLQDLSPKEFDILAMAISCEVANSYESLKAIQEHAYNMFQELTKTPAIPLGQRPQDPDSPYSPFNQGSALYRILHPAPPAPNP